jgi:hypothetical protein
VRAVRCRSVASRPAVVLGILLASVPAFVVTAAPSARAEEPQVDYADGVPGCRTFRERNERDLAIWQKEQPKNPYVYPREPRVFGAPWPALYEGLSSALGVLAATAIPHVGAQLRGGEPAAYIAWPWSLPIGAPSSCRRPRGSFTLKEHKTHRLLVGPGFVASNRGLGVFTRPGYRFVLHPTDWVVGVGGGLGSTVEIAGNREPFRFSVSPEVLAHFGHCCEPGYFTLAFRYDRFFAGDTRDVFGSSLGFTYF